MRTRTLPGIESDPGWSHPYPTGPFSPFFYKDGGDDQDDEVDEDDQEDDDGTDWKAEAEKWKAQSRKHEQRAKDNASAAKERDRLRREGLPDQERKVEEAVAKALAEERAKGGVKLARQAFLAAAKGSIDNAAEVADDVNLGRYVKDDGDVDEDGLAELVKRLAPKKSGTDENDEDDDREGGRDTRRRRRGGGFDQGARRRGGGKSGGSVESGRELYRTLLGGGAEKN
ncbi:MAG TPA: hypothetical protein VIU15_38435 [Streptomyces sp.]